MFGLQVYAFNTNLYLISQLFLNVGIFFIFIFLIDIFIYFPLY